MQKDQRNLIVSIALAGTVLASVTTPVIASALSMTASTGTAFEKGSPVASAFEKGSPVDSGAFLKI